ncbi:hypothetical protein GCM10011273_18390 [Asticcacaulis endophyticus]|uniref:Type IV secretory pathway, VirD2 components (Relaxase) n=2 Tax=Asticcacaulis endophyticus TaxID=1395890 RepID=A0A918Q583_9CAUL|nr:hypothetical protein GCM10011273_18390 [Asticcacaulis endophyticus]
MADLSSFTRDLMNQAQRDLGTGLDWVGVSHWNTDQPHVHIILRGVTDTGEDLVISRDYIKEGMRARAQELITDELGPRTELDMQAHVRRQISADRFTQLDRQLISDSRATGFVDLAPTGDHTPDVFHVMKVGRMRKLEGLGLAHEIGAGQWVIAARAEPTLRELGQRGDIIKRIHQGLAEQGINRGTAGYVLAGEGLGQPIVGRLMARGLDDELKGTGYAVIDGTDGRTHHVSLPSLDASGDSVVGSIVEVRQFEDRDGNTRSVLAVRSDLPIERQTTALGSTWLDRQAILGKPSDLSEGGFGAEVRQALDRRAEHLIEHGLAKRQGDQVVFAKSLLQTLKQREIDAACATITDSTGLSFNPMAAGEHASGIYTQRLNLASGRFAMLDDGVGFKLVPWTPALESKLGQQISGVARDNGGIDWSFGQKRGLEI